MPEADERPWEEPWVSRRDCEPHCGPWLHRLARISLLCGVISVVFGLLAMYEKAYDPKVWCYEKIWLRVPQLLFLVVAALVGFPVRLQAIHDWNLMRVGLMDSEGRKYVEKARRSAFRGIVQSLISAVLFILNFL